MYAILAGASMLISIWLALKSVKAEEMTINDSTNGITVYLNKMDGETAGDVWSGVGYLKDWESRKKKAEEKGFIAKLGEALEKKTAILHHPYIRGRHHLRGGTTRRDLYLFLDMARKTWPLRRKGRP